MSNKITIVIADDHPLFRMGLRQVVEGEAGMEIVGEAGDGQRALQMIRALKPNVAITEIGMPNVDGFDLARAVQKENLPVGMIFLTMHCDESYLKKAIDLGVRGYVAKDSAVTHVISCIEAVSAGQHFTSPALTTRLIKASWQTANGRGARTDKGLGDLSRCELRVLELIAEFKTSADIAGALYISPRTVESHRTHICQKLGLHGSHALMKFALERKGWFEEHPYENLPNELSTNA
jgi:DNA-binding NarL/FixJ family response regulator